MRPFNRYFLHIGVIMFLSLLMPSFLTIQAGGGEPDGLQFQSTLNNGGGQSAGAGMSLVISVGQTIAGRQGNESLNLELGWLHSDAPSSNGTPVESWFLYK